MKKMYGVVPPLITPFDEYGNIDYKALETLLDFLVEKVDGLFVTGSYGSGALMNVEERKKVAETIVNKLKNKLDIVIMTGTTNNADTVELTKHAEYIGADAVSAVGPYYYKHNNDNLMCFYEDMVKAVSDDFSIYVYNNPSFQGYPMDISLLQALKNIGIKGIKDATFDILLHASYSRLLKDEDFDVVLGTESMWLPARSLGCEAFIPGLGNVFPEICRDMHREGMADRIEKCRELQFKVNKLRDIMYMAKSTQLAVYAMLELRGIIKAYPRRPFVPAKNSEKEKIRVALKELGLSE